jgi:effector-binding domain-containing protein
VEPRIEARTEQPYVSITTRVPMTALGDRVPALTGEVFEWVGSRGLQPAGPPLWKYNRIDMAHDLEVEAGVAVDGDVPDDERVRRHTLPAGRYAVARHVGHPDGLEQATRELLDWATTQGLRWDVSYVDGVEHWNARIEEYLTDPAEQPDMNQWVTNLAFKLAD